MSKLNKWGIKVLNTYEPPKKIEFNIWMTQLKVSSLYKNKDGIYKAMELNNNYNFKKLNK